MFENVSELFELLKGFFDFGESSIGYVSQILPSPVPEILVSFFLLLGIVAVIKLVKGLVSLIGGIASGFIV